MAHRSNGVVFNIYVYKWIDICISENQSISIWNRILEWLHRLQVSNYTHWNGIEHNKTKRVRERKKSNNKNHRMADGWCAGVIDISKKMYTIYGGILWKVNNPENNATIEEKRNNSELSQRHEGNIVRQKRKLQICCLSINGSDSFADHRC